MEQGSDCGEPYVDSTADCCYPARNGRCWNKSAKAVSSLRGDSQGLLLGLLDLGGCCVGSTLGGEGFLQASNTSTGLLMGLFSQRCSVYWCKTFAWHGLPNCRATDIGGFQR